MSGPLHPEGVGGGQGKRRVMPAIVMLTCLVVGMPLAWGVYRTLISAAQHFS